MARGNFKDKLILVSNREPFSVRKGKVEKTVGGLVSALDPVMRSSRGVWIASGGARESKRRFSVPPDDPSYTMLLIGLTQKDIDNYYHGYSNSFLWPLCHLRLDYLKLKKTYWTSYKKVNSLFADAVVAEAKKKGSLVWLQDFQLSLCAARIKEKRPDLKLSLFWHIPWPPYDIFRACPHRKEILEGLLANDMLGFQLDTYKVNFMRCVYRELGASVLREGFVVHRGHLTRIKSFPISVDFDYFDKTASKRRAVSFFERFKRDRGLEGKLIGLSVDRLDYTKGILKCLDTLDVFFKRYKRFRGRLTFIQVAVPTRKSEPFLSYMQLVHDKVDAINSRYQTDDWRPIEYIEKSFNHKDLAALYRGSDLLMINSVYDGMNLVVKEYVSSQVEQKGSLLVSMFAGAAEDMPGAVTINPYDIESCAEEMKKALETSPGEKKEALIAARRFVKENDIYKWVEDILQEMQKLQ